MTIDTIAMGERMSSFREEVGDSGVQRSLGMIAILTNSIREEDLRAIYTDGGFDLSDEDVFNDLAEVCFWFEQEGVLTITDRMYPSLADGSNNLFLQSLDSEAMQTYIISLKSDGQLIRNGL